MQLYFETHAGRDPATLVLLHGVGANGAVWNRVLERLAGRWPGRIRVPDLRGHGRSPHAARYALGFHAADVAELLEPGTPVWIAGHSMGGAIGIALAGGTFGLAVRGVLALGVKPSFSEADVERAAAFAAKPSREFATRSEAAGRFLAVNALAGLVPEDDAAVAHGIARTESGYRLSADPKTVLAGSPPLASMLRAAIAPVRLVTGECDPVAPPAALRDCADEVVVVAGAAHNLHVERPDVIAQLALDAVAAGVR